MYMFCALKRAEVNNSTILFSRSYKSLNYRQFFTESRINIIIRRGVLNSTHSTRNLPQEKGLSFESNGLNPNVTDFLSNLDRRIPTFRSLVSRISNENVFATFSRSVANVEYSPRTFITFCSFLLPFSKIALIVKLQSKLLSFFP